jgi:hypothetical protein
MLAQPTNQIAANPIANVLRMPKSSLLEREDESVPQSRVNVFRSKGPMQTAAILCLLWLLAGCATSSSLFRARTAAGLPPKGKTFGGAILDADGDGRLDLFLSRHAHAPQVYRNVGRLRFRACGPGQEGWPSLVDEHGAAAMDVDGDGIGDVYVTVGAQRGTTEGFNALWRGRPACGYEVDAAAPGFLADPHGRGRGALWLDLAADGALDLLVFNEATPARLFTHAMGDWQDRTTELPRADGSWLHTACAGDLDGDGMPELLVAGATNRLLGTDAAGGLRDVSATAGFQSQDVVADAQFADVDGDGDLDLVLACEKVGLRTWINDTGRTLRLTQGPVQDLGAPRPWSLVVEDFDNDGMDDVYVTRLGVDQTNLPNELARGLGDGRFEPWPAQDASADVFSGSTGAWAVDFDHDGDLDLLALQGAGPSPTQPGGALLYENRCRRNGVTVELLGADPRRPALGARAILHTASGLRTDWVRSDAAPWNSTAPRLHFGVGDERGPFPLEVHWPDGAQQTVTLPRARAAYRLVQGEAPIQLR